MKFRVLGSAWASTTPLATEDMKALRRAFKKWLAEHQASAAAHDRSAPTFRANTKIDDGARQHVEVKLVVQSSDEAWGLAAFEGFVELLSRTCPDWVWRIDDDAYALFGNDHNWQDGQNGRSLKERYERRTRRAHPTFQAAIAPDPNDPLEAELDALFASLGTTRREALTDRKEGS